MIRAFISYETRGQDSVYTVILDLFCLSSFAMRKTSTLEVCGIFPEMFGPLQENWFTPSLDESKVFIFGVRRFQGRLCGT